MKKLIGLLALCFVISLPALAQRHEGGGGRPEVGGGRQNIPKRGPARVELHALPKNTAPSTKKKDIPMHRTWIAADSG